MDVKIINESELSKESKDFIRKFSTMNQDKYDKLSDAVEHAQRPVTAAQAEYIIS